MGSRRNRRKRIQKERLRQQLAGVPIPARLSLDAHMDHLRNIGLTKVADLLEPLATEKLRNPNNSDFYRWRSIIEDLPTPAIHPIEILLHQDTVTLWAPSTAEQKTNLQELLMGLKPWRKGPLSIMGIHIDTEWRSDWKWNRLIAGNGGNWSCGGAASQNGDIGGGANPAARGGDGSFGANAPESCGGDGVYPKATYGIGSLKGKRILDLGCGNGYHCLRMLGAGAESVTGVDPSWFSFFQFQAVQHFLQDPRVAVLPLQDTHLIGLQKAFDMVFSMGVIYHQRLPVEHLKQLHSLLVPGGQCVVETLIIDSPKATKLNPPERYGKMRNVVVIPSVKQMEQWLKQAGFSDITLLDITPTTVEEQRSTPWMPFESLKDYLNPKDPTQTIEGHPAPIRAAWVARRGS